MKRKQIIFLILVVVHLFLLYNLRFEAWPEMLVYPYLLKNGFLLYKDIINPYVPFLSWFLYGFFSVFELDVYSLKLLAWGIIIVIDILVYLIGLRWYGERGAVCGLVFYIIFQPLLDGNGLWFDLALVPVLLLAFYWQSPFWLGVGFFVKQSVLWLLIVFLKQWKRLLMWLAFLFLVSLVPMMILGIVDDYMFWVWKFTFFIFPKMPGHKDFGSVALWGLACLPFVLPVIVFWQKKMKQKRFCESKEPFVWMFLSLMFIVPRFGLFHLQPALAFAAIAVAGFFQKPKLFQGLFAKLFFGVYFLLIALVWFRQINLFWHKPVRFFEPEIVQAAETLKKEIDSKEPVLFLNAPDQLMVLAGILPTKPWAITFPWYFEVFGMQERFIKVMEVQKVKYVVFSPYGTEGKFVPGSYVPQQLDRFVGENYANDKLLFDSVYVKKVNDF